MNEIPTETLLKYAVRDLRDSKIKIGKLESYIDELEYKLKEIKSGITFYKYKKKIKTLEKKNEKLKEEIYELNYKLKHGK